MGYEFDFLPVGNGDKSGDAIAVRYGTEGNYKIMVIDGGTKDSGESLVSHIKEYYNTEHVDYVVNTHPDGDHASGLTVVLEKLSVGELWMHRPWEHSSEIRDMFKDGRITDNSLAERIKDGLNFAYSLEKLANEKEIPIYEPYQGAHIGEFIVLSPSEEQYLELVPQFKNTPVPKKDDVRSAIYKLGQSIMETVRNFVEEKWDLETLQEGGETTAQNNSSVVLYANIDNKGLLLSGDAGVIALTWAADYAESCGIDLSACKFIQVPHHGSRNNVSPTILDRIVGPIVGEETTPTVSAFVSASQDSKKHPKKVVLNAFKRRGAKVFATQGGIKWHHYNMPARSSYSTAEPLPFYNEVEE